LEVKVLSVTFYCSESIYVTYFPLPTRWSGIDTEDSVLDEDVTDLRFAYRLSIIMEKTTLLSIVG
jgi:hypothetical protein